MLSLHKSYLDSFYNVTCIFDMLQSVFGQHVPECYVTCCVLEIADSDQLECNLCVQRTMIQVQQSLTERACQTTLFECTYRDGGARALHP